MAHRGRTSLCTALPGGGCLHRPQLSWLEVSPLTLGLSSPETGCQHSQELSPAPTSQELSPALFQNWGPPKGVPVLTHEARLLSG